jgi:hypothetical protein
MAISGESRRHERADRGRTSRSATPPVAARPPDADLIGGNAKPRRVLSRMAVVAVAIAGLLLLAAAAASASWSSNPPHGHWVKGKTGPVLRCDATYYPVDTACLRPRAFDRPATRADRAPSVIRGLRTRSHEVRLIAWSRDPAGHVWREYLVDETRDEPCIEVMRGTTYWGGLCFSGNAILGSAANSAWVSGINVLVGIAANDADVVHLSGHQTNTTYFLSPDRGFILFCSNCCNDLTRLSVSYRGRTIGSDDLRGFRCS